MKLNVCRLQKESFFVKHQSFFKKYLLMILPFSTLNFTTSESLIYNSDILL